MSSAEGGSRQTTGCPHDLQGRPAVQSIEDHCGGKEPTTPATPYKKKRVLGRASRPSTRGTSSSPVWSPHHDVLRLALVQAHTRQRDRGQDYGRRARDLYGLGRRHAYGNRATGRVAQVGVQRQKGDPHGCAEPGLRPAGGEDQRRPELCAGIREQDLGRMRLPQAVLLL